MQLVQISKRHQLGVIALLCFVVAAVLWFAPIGGNRPAAIGGSLRLGLAFGVVWLALPNLIELAQRAPKWYWYICLLGLVLAAVQPRPWIFIVPPFLLVLWFFAPKVKKYTEPSSRPRKRGA